VLKIGKFLYLLGLLSRQFSKRHVRPLHLVEGTTVCWFMLDIAFYSQTLFQLKDLYARLWTGLPKADTINALQEMFKISRG
jgi:MFS transporter, PHS family, inorganic phosphate transporter